MFTLRKAAIRRVPVAARTFASSSRLQSAGSHVSDNDPEVIQREKDRNLHDKHSDPSAPHKEYAPGWNENLASVSEAFIKADQAPAESPEELTKVTIEHIRERYHEEDSPNTLHKATAEVFEATQSVTSKDIHEKAHYERDEVEGPLGGKGSGSSKTERDEVHGPLRDAGKRS